MSKIEKRPPVGVDLTVDIEEVQLKSGGVPYWARVRWTDPVTSRRDGVNGLIRHLMRPQPGSTG